MRYTDYFKSTRMPRDLHGFAEKAIEIAGQAGERKRKNYKDMEQMLAKSRMAEIERRQQGATRRVGMQEAGLTSRLSIKPSAQQDPGGLKAAQAAEIRQGLEFEEGSKATLEDILASKAALGRTRAEEAGIGLSEGRRKIRLRDEAEATAQAEAAVPSISGVETVAKPGRKLRSSLKKALWEGTPTKSGFTLPGLGAPLYGYKNIADWLGAGMQKGYEYAFPRSR